jgi:hypothetical protein
MAASPSSSLSSSQHQPLQYSKHIQNQNQIR